MKFKICHDPNKDPLHPPCRTPDVQAGGCGGADHPHGERLCPAGRDDLTAAECVGVMKLLTDNTVALMEQLAKATQEAAEEKRL